MIGSAGFGAPAFTSEGVASVLLVSLASLRAADLPWRRSFA